MVRRRKSQRPLHLLKEPPTKDAVKEERCHEELVIGRAVNCMAVFMALAPTAKSLVTITITGTDSRFNSAISM